MGYILVVLFIIAVGVAAWKICRAIEAHSEYPDSRKTASKVRLGVTYAVPTLVLVATLWSAAYQVPAGHVGIVYTFGGITGQRSDGLQWIYPWQEVGFASIRVQRHHFEKLDSFSRETQNVFVAATINVRVSPASIQALYRDVGPEYFDILVHPRVLQAFKDETVKYASVDIAPHREQIRRAVRERLTNELREHSIEVQDLLMDNLWFEPDFQTTIEQKQNNTQIALAEKELVAAETYRADQAIEKARGTAEPILINAKKQAEANYALAASITDQLVRYAFVTKLAPNVNVMIVPSGQQFILSPDMFEKRPTPTMPDSTATKPTMPEPTATKK